MSTAVKIIIAVIVVLLILLLIAGYVVLLMPLNVGYRNSTFFGCPDTHTLTPTEKNRFTCMKDGTAIPPTWSPDNEWGFNGFLASIRSGWFGIDTVRT